ncbi:hypothetical protein OROMI_028782 [Orobanche minor]
MCYREVKPGMYGGLGETMLGCNKWPSDPPNFKILMEDYVNRCTDLSRKIMRGIALALGGPMDVFEGNRAGDPFWVLRVIGYPVNGNKIPNEQNDVGWYVVILRIFYPFFRHLVSLISNTGAHTDYGLLTLVNQDDDITALQLDNPVRIINQVIGITEGEKQ